MGYTLSVKSETLDVVALVFCWGILKKEEAKACYASWHSR
jgi:hypothetical protein